MKKSEEKQDRMILVIDDQRNMCWILSKVLSDAGFEVKTANTVKEALAIADKYEVSAAIIDFRLPDGNGLDLFLQLRKKDGKVPGILITSYGSSTLYKEAIKLGFFAYVDKPFDNKLLITTVKEAINS